MGRKRRITEWAFGSYFDCTYKAFLQLHGRKGTATAYEQHRIRLDTAYGTAGTARLEAQCTEQEVLRRAQLTPSAAFSGRRLILADRVVADRLTAGPTVLVAAPHDSHGLQPVHFQRYPKVTIRDKLLLGFKAVLIGKLTGATPTRGKIIHGGNFEGTSVPLSAHTKNAQSIIEQLEEMSTSKDQRLFLNYHCNVCEFREVCRAKAEAEDNMSLLQGMRRGHIEKQNKKGIVTVHQLSYTFRPRRTPKRAKNPTKPRHFALQAQAIRENMVYIHGTPELPTSQQSLYFDIEGIPESSAYYLVGVLVEANDTVEYHSFWADDDAGQTAMFTRFCRFAATFPEATLYHNGNYDLVALKEIRAEASALERELVDRAIDACYNVLPLLRSHCYFPLYSTRLRDVAAFLGCQLDSRIHSGAESIIFREQWEATPDNALRRDLVAYNREDCLALKMVCDFLRTSVGLATKRHKVPGRDEEMALSNTLRRAGEGNRPTFKTAEFALPEFDFANRCAYFDYQRERVYARASNKPRARRQRKHVSRTSRRWSQGSDVVVRCDECPQCGSKRLNPEKEIRRRLIDLRYFKTGIGVKRWQPHYAIWRYRCRCCGERVVSPAVRFNAQRRTIYGHGLICWCVYHNIVGKQSMLQVERSLYDIFGIELPFGGSYRFRTMLTSYYRPLYDEILREILKGSVVNIDETPVKLKKTTGYVWVLATSDKVYCLYRESREGAFLQDLLADFDGVLVSDFFTAYDSLACRHQKCLLHLMRDINDDLWKHPYDAEFRSIAEEFGGFLASAVTSIDRWGLKGYHLRKHVKQSERLLRKVTGRPLKSDCALKYQKRFDKYRESLFTFLTHDGVPWNNNNAEHAINYFAKLRRFTDGTFTRRSIEELLTILSVLQTCEYNNVNALRFLLSGETGLSCITARDSKE